MPAPRSPFPRYIEFQTVSVCNSRCQICPMEWVATALPHGKMSDEMIAALLDECREHKEWVVSLEPYLNNEPFADRRFLNVLRTIREDFDCNIEVSTNASLLTSEISRAILDEELIDDFRFSVFGASRETHERVMAGLSWDRVRANLLEYARLWNERGRKIRSRLVFVENEVVLPEGEYERARELWAPTGLGWIHWAHLDRAANNRIKLNQHLLRRGNRNVVGCHGDYLRERLVIMYNGDVLLCCQDWSREVVIGTLREQSLEEIWHSPECIRYFELIYDPLHSDPNLMCVDCEFAVFEGNSGPYRPEWMVREREEQERARAMSGDRRGSGS